MKEELDLSEISITYDGSAYHDADHKLLLMGEAGSWWATIYRDDIIQLRDFLNQLEL